MFHLFEKNRQTENICEKEKVAKILASDVEKLAKFEGSYQKFLNEQLKDIPDNFFDINSRQMADQMAGIELDTDYPLEKLEDVINRIVEELIADTDIWSYNGQEIHASFHRKFVEPLVTNEELMEIPENIRPQLTGFLYKKDVNIDPEGTLILEMYQRSLKEKNPKKRKMFYDHFRQGLDFMDLDPLTYAVLGMNRNSMGNWLPQITKTVRKQGFFKIPETTIIKVPLPLLQLSRLEYPELTRTTLDIVDLYCRKIFCLDKNKDYFIKNGVHSSKFDFRNAHVHGEKEVRELGEYLLFLHHQASQMAAPLTNPCIYGAATTNEWVVREFIHDKENNPCIYKGLPLHTEYRVFVDFDTKEVLAVAPYWEPKVMKQRFSQQDDADDPDNIHDYVIYRTHEDTLMKRFSENRDMVGQMVQDLVEESEGLYGQWSIDIMQNGNDFWLIDMALAQVSALQEYIPAEKRRIVQEHWFPDQEFIEEKIRNWENPIKHMEEK